MTIAELLRQQGQAEGLAEGEVKNEMKTHVAVKMLEKGMSFSDMR